MTSTGGPTGALARAWRRPAGEVVEFGPGDVVPAVFAALVEACRGRRLAFDGDRRARGHGDGVPAGTGRPRHWAADTLAELGAHVHLAGPLGVKMFSLRRVKNDQRDAADLANLLRMGRLLLQRRAFAACHGP